MIVTAGTLEESREALKLAKAHPNLYSTVGVHPTRCSEFFGGGNASGDSEAHVAALAAVLEEGKELGKVRKYSSRPLFVDVCSSENKREEVRRRAVIEIYV